MQPAVFRGNANAERAVQSFGQIDRILQWLELAQGEVEIRAPLAGTPDRLLVESRDHVENSCSSPATPAAMRMRSVIETATVSLKTMKVRLCPPTRKMVAHPPFGNSENESGFSTCTRCPSAR